MYIIETRSKVVLNKLDDLGAEIVANSDELTLILDKDCLEGFVEELQKFLDKA